MTTKIEKIENEINAENSGKKCFSKIKMNKNGNLLGNCKKCAAASPEIVEACSLVSNVKIQPAAEPKKARTKKPFSKGIELWLCGWGKTEMAEHFKSAHEMKDGPAKKFANDIHYVGKVFAGRGLKKGGLIDIYVEWLETAKSGQEPTGCKSTIGFVKNFAQSWTEFTV